MTTEFLWPFIGLTFFSLCILLLIFRFGERHTNEAASLNAAIEIRRVHFAAGAACSLMYVFCLGMLMAFCSSGKDSVGLAVFDAVKTVVPPIVTMVLGYYFGSSKDRSTDGGREQSKVERDDRK